MCDLCYGKDENYDADPAGNWIFRKKGEPELSLETRLHQMRREGKLKFLGAGRHRATYLLPSGRAVVKFPRNTTGIEANQAERNAYREDTGDLDLVTVAEVGWKRPGSKYRAACRLVGRLLVMEFVDRQAFVEGTASKFFPDWAMNTDRDSWGPQMGLTRSGRVAFFDYTPF